MKDYHKKKESSYISYWGVNNLYVWVMPQKLPVNNFEWIKDTSQFNEDFIKNFNEESGEGYFLEVGIQYLEKLHERRNDLSYLPERMNIEKVQKCIAYLHEKTEYVIHIRNLKQALTHGLVLKKVRKVIKFNQKAWLKPYIDMNTDLRKKAKNDFEKDFLSWWIIQFLVKLWKMWKKHGDIKLVTTAKRRNYLPSELNYHTTNFFTEHLLAIETKKKQKNKDNYE